MFALFSWQQIDHGEQELGFLSVISMVELETETPPTPSTR